MSIQRPTLRAYLFTNGWMEIQNPANSDDEWIATDSPRILEP